MSTDLNKEFRRKIGSRVECVNHLSIIMHTRKREQLLLKDAKPHPDISLLQKNLKPLGKSRKTYCEFHTLHLGERWKITSLLETGRKPSCVPLIRHHLPLVKCQDL